MAVYKSKTPTKDNRCWYFKTKYTDKYGNIKQKRSKSFATKVEAIKAETSFLIRMETTGIDIPVSMNFRTLYNEFYKKQAGVVKLTSLKTYNNYFKHFKIFEKTKVANFTGEQFEIWKKETSSSNKYTIGNLNSQITFWKTLLNFAMIEYGFELEKEYKKIKFFVNTEVIEKRHNTYSLVDFRKFIANEDDLMLICFWELLFYCGLNFAELIGLQWKKISLRNKTIKINDQYLRVDKNHFGYAYERCNLKSPKNVRTISINRAPGRHLRQLSRKLRAEGSFNRNNLIFSYDGETPIAMSILLRRKKWLATQAKLKEITFKDFRHSCALLLLSNGASITSVSSYLGFGETTDCLATYSYMIPSTMPEVVNIINAINNKNKSEKS